MKNLIKIIVSIVALLSFLEAKSTVTIGHTMYQKQKFTYRTDVRIFATDKEGSRVWNWRHAQKYCQNLKLAGYRDWQVASKAELLKIMADYEGYNGLYIKRIYGGQYMPEPDPKYHNVWMWTRDSSGNLGAFVNFKKATYGWADKKYKGYVICTRKAAKKEVASQNSGAKQELSHSHSWLKVCNTCEGYTALKKDGTLWQFGKVGVCGFGEIIPLDQTTGKPIHVTHKYKYYLKAKKIGIGFRGAKFINGGDNMYAIKRDGTLWGWGRAYGHRAKKLSSSKWADFAEINAGNGCCELRVGLKKDATMWGYKESYTSKLKKLSPYKWKKILLDCCTIYGLRADNTLWTVDTFNSHKVFKKYNKHIKHIALSRKYKQLLNKKMRGVRKKIIYDNIFPKFKKARKDGTLYLNPIRE